MGVDFCDGKRLWRMRMKKVEKMVDGRSCGGIGTVARFEISSGKI